MGSGLATTPSGPAEISRPSGKPGSSLCWTSRSSSRKRGGLATSAEQCLRIGDGDMEFVASRRQAGPVAEIELEVGSG